MRRAQITITAQTKRFYCNDKVEVLSVNVKVSRLFTDLRFLQMPVRKNPVIDTDCKTGRATLSIFSEIRIAVLMMRLGGSISR